MKEIKIGTKGKEIEQKYTIERSTKPKTGSSQRISNLPKKNRVEIPGQGSLAP